MTTVAADIGGTHARFAFIEDGALGAPEKQAVRDFPGLIPALASWCARYNRKAEGELLIATAAQPGADGVWRFLNGNNPWVVDRKALLKAGWHLKILVNDFAASAHGAVRLPADSLAVLRPGSGQTGANRAILGPGTGLGMAFMIPLADGRWHVQETFGGHMLAAALTDEQTQIIKFVRELREGRTEVVPEDLASGRALPGLYQAVCLLNKQRPQLATADEILADAGKDMPRQAVRLFHEFLGLFAHNVAVTTNSFGGIYLDGGVVQRLHEKNLFDRAAFERFFIPAVVPSVHAALAATPVWLVRDPFVALRGLAEMVDNNRHA
jgi:glucokinase